VLKEVCFLSLVHQLVDYLLTLQHAFFGRHCRRILITCFHKCVLSNQPICCAVLIDVAQLFELFCDVLAWYRTGTVAIGECVSLTYGSELFISELLQVLTFFHDDFFFLHLFAGFFCQPI
jgi:hypothetical protein